MLPPEVFSEINCLYAGELTRLILKKQEKNVNIFKTPSIPQIVQGKRFLPTRLRMNFTSS